MKRNLVGHVMASRASLIVYSILVSVMFYWFPDIFVSSSHSLLQVKCVALFFLYLFYIIYWPKYTGSANSLSFFFLVYSMLTNGGQLLMIGFNLSPELYYTLDSTSLFSDQVLLKAVNFQAIATIIYATCALLSFRRFNRLNEQSEKVYLRDFTGSYKIAKSDVIFIVVSLVFILLSVAALAGRVDMGYGDNYYRDDRESSAFIFKFLFYVMLFFTLYKHSINKDRFVKPILGIAATVALLLLLWGSRNELIPLVFGLLFIAKRINLTLTRSQKFLTLAGVIIGLVVLNITASLRGMSLSSLSFELLFDAFTDNGIISQMAGLLAEMGSSLRVLADTIQRVDANPEICEMTLVYTLLKGFVWLPILNMLGIHEPVNWSLSYWITNSNAIGFAAGWGYSLLSECYYNCQMAGFLVFGLIGYIYAWLELKVADGFQNGKLLLSSGWLYVAAYAIFMARADSCLMSTPIKYAFYLTIIWVFSNMNKLKF